MDKNQEIKLDGSVSFLEPANVAMPLVSFRDDLPVCWGTCVLLAPEVAVTAWHVPDQWAKGIRRKGRGIATDLDFPVTAYQWFEGSFYEWSVDASYGSQSSEIAFLRFRRPAWFGKGPGQVTPPSARISFNPPGVGDEVRVFGFPDSKVENGVLVLAPAENRCRVRNVEMKNAIPGRPFSYIEIEGDIEHGMSGGPCFDRDWRVVGINSHGWTFLDEPSLAYVALLWPAMSIEIDPFRSGAFPALDLFRGRADAAMGYTRLHVTAQKQVRLSKVDRNSLIPSTPSCPPQAFFETLNLAISNAQAAIHKIRDLLGSAGSHKSFDTNDLLTLLRYFFWELESALNLSVLLAARNLSLPITLLPDWESLMTRGRAVFSKNEKLDELVSLDFLWHGIDLFEVRTFAQLSRSGILRVNSLESVEGGNGEREVVAVVMDSARIHGGQVQLPDGLDHFLLATRRFVRSLLTITEGSQEIPKS